MDKTKMIHLRMTEKVHREIRLACADRGVTIQAYLLELAQKDIEKLKKKGGILLEKK